MVKGEFEQLTKAIKGRIHKSVKRGINGAIDEITLTIPQDISSINQPPIDERYCAWNHSIALHKQFMGRARNT